MPCSVGDRHLPKNPVVISGLCSSEALGSSDTMRNRRTDCARELGS